KMPVCGEFFQVKRARIVGAQGHSGHGNFPNVISSMAAGMDLTPMITKEISIEMVPDNLKLLQTDRENCKISVRIN
ncbi:MAG: alcohol dehydrogenase, partial [Candidatus Heimdallarchaeota archaeon]